MDEKDLNILRAAILTFGPEHQINIIKEELAEFIAAICRLNRTDTRKDRSAILTDICNEFADVEIMIAQFKLIYPDISKTADEYRSYKITRLKNIIKENFSNLDGDDAQQKVAELIN